MGLIGVNVNKRDRFFNIIYLTAIKIQRSLKGNTLTIRTNLKYAD